MAKKRRMPKTMGFVILWQGDVMTYSKGELTQSTCYRPATIFPTRPDCRNAMASDRRFQGDHPDPGHFDFTIRRLVEAP